MTALAGIRPHPYAAVSYRAYRVTPMFKNPHNGVTGNRTTALDIGEPVSLDDARNAAAARCQHKDTLLIRETGDHGDMLHLYAIKRKSAPSYEYDRNHILHRMNTLYADFICKADASVLGVPDNEVVVMVGGGG